MGTLTVRNLDDAVKQRLRERAARRGVSMEREMREIIKERSATPRRNTSIFDALTRLGVKPVRPFDQKSVSDEMWDEGIR
ncbi:FitA-like ribbon-helix-helix domain-containing protein [Mesorhizobium sp. ASY16-5R]|uniref:FitA-like ribbon-helix-helix domain-containing protein n=1 Tax=Mesorhizobium sp. ASY16-5R TaxID=3445772 RepID=UPI003FA11976